jgi:hypothetical protein
VFIYLESDGIYGIRFQKYYMIGKYKVVGVSLNQT